MIKNYLKLESNKRTFKNINVYKFHLLTLMKSVTFMSRHLEKEKLNGRQSVSA